MNIGVIINALNPASHKAKYYEIPLKVYGFINTNLMSWDDVEHDKT